MGHFNYRLFNVPYLFLADNHDLSITDIINICGAQAISIDHIDFSQDPVMANADHSEPAAPINQEALLSSSSATVFLYFVMNGGGGYLESDVEAEILAAKEALANVGVSWVELLEALRVETRDTKDVCL